jgi:hypothetical protein
MPDAIASVRLKLTRAYKHLKEIISIEERLRQSPKCRVVCKIGSNPNMVDFVLRLPIPRASLSIIVGDCIHNARSSLDHLIYALAEVTATKSGIQRSERDRRASMFPICLCPSGDFSSFDREVNERRRLNNIPSAAAAIIQGLQPQDRADLLWILSELENIDKHRKLALTAVAATDLDIDTGGSRVSATNRLVPYHNGDTVFGEAIADTTRTALIEAQMKVQLQAATFVALQDPPATGRAVSALIQGTLNRIGDVIVPALEPFFN